MDSSHQATLSMGFSRLEYRTGLSFPSPGDLPNPGIEARSPTSQAEALLSEPPGKLNVCKNMVYFPWVIGKLWSPGK